MSNKLTLAELIQQLEQIQNEQFVTFDNKTMTLNLNEYLNFMNTKLDWTESDSKAAVADGWDVFEVEGYLDIQKSDEADVFAEDTAAIAHVFWNATAGSELHTKALHLIMNQEKKPPYPVHNLKRIKR